MPLHPSIVHFPPVLLLAAGILYLLGGIRRKPWIEIVGFAFHVAGLIFCIVAIFTGDFESDRIATDPAIRTMMGRHENLVMTATYGFGMLGVWAFLRQKSTVMLEKIAFQAVYFGLVVVLLLGAHVGGELVYTHGAGIAPMQELLQGKEDGQVGTSNGNFNQESK